MKRFIGHGVQDAQISINLGRDTNKSLETLGLDITYKEYNIGHTITLEEVYDTVEWIKDL